MRIIHTILRVVDLERSLAFYIDTPRSDVEVIAFVEYPDGHRFELIESEAG